jgi:glycosyltransferase involved in cell wall biosynthesis
MHIALVADVYPPMRSSGAVQLRDLACELAAQGHRVTVLTPDSSIKSNWAIERSGGIELVRLRAFRTRDTNYVRRMFAELTMPYLMRRHLLQSPLARQAFDGIVWYSPTIFLGPLIRWLKARSNCPSYLVIRDIFPEWAYDMGLIKKGPIYRFLQHIADSQYSVADVIGVQTPGNLKFFADRRSVRGRTEVLHNWLAPAHSKGCSIDLASTRLENRRIVVYAGNMGVAQGMSIVLDMAAALQHDDSIGFVLVGRGTDAETLRLDARSRKLENVLFFDEIDPDEIAGLYDQSQVGLVILDPLHTTHNIPGKFISYMHSGLPAFAVVNSGNDIIRLIRDNRVGFASATRDAVSLAASLGELVNSLSTDHSIKAECRKLATNLFSSSAAAKQITMSLETVGKHPNNLPAFESDTCNE